MGVYGAPAAHLVQVKCTGISDLYPINHSQVHSKITDPAIHKWSFVEFSAFQDPAPLTCNNVLAQRQNLKYIGSNFPVHLDCHW